MIWCMMVKKNGKWYKYFKHGLSEDPYDVFIAFRYTFDLSGATEIMYPYPTGKNSIRELRLKDRPNRFICK